VQKAGLRQGYLSLIEGGSQVAVSEDALGRIAAALGIEPWVILAQAACLKLDQVELFTEDERIWLDTYRALGSEQRDVVLQVATVMRGPQPQEGQMNRLRGLRLASRLRS
jgi:transcriptional regulator with XRE-family HTH domain